MECCNHFTKYDTRNALWAVYFQIVIFYFHKKMIEFKIYQKKEDKTQSKYVTSSTRHSPVQIELYCRFFSVEMEI